jgi:hypothetical protein
MKKNLNEQISRMKNMMGLNEDQINMDEYNEEDDVIVNITRVGKSKNKNPILSFVIRAFIPSTSTNEGETTLITVVVEWEEHDKHVKWSRTGEKRKVFYVKKLISINSDIQLDNLTENYLREIFKESSLNEIDNVLNKIYSPYRYLLKKKGGDYEKQDNMLSKYHNENASKIENLIMSKKEPITDKKSMWTSTNTWNK